MNLVSENMGFSQMVRKLSNRPDLPIKKYENDLLQISQLRNAIVHEKIGENFVIAEPNQWLVNRIRKIEMDLLQPELVLPRLPNMSLVLNKTFRFENYYKSLLKNVTHSSPYITKDILKG